MIRITNGGAWSATGGILTCEIIEKLCKKYCVNTTPIVTTTANIANTETINGTMYATIQVVCAVTYTPKGACRTCGQVTNTFTESFVVSAAGATSISITSYVNAYTNSAYICNNNCNVAQGIDNVGTITIAVA